jgi:predicted Na+-dependent transporter
MAGARPVQIVRRYPELFVVLIAAVLGLIVQSPLAFLASHQGINALLVILVFATAITIEPAAIRRAASAWPTLMLTLLAGATVLPVLSWLVSQLVASGSLRDGVMTIGLAPCEIASVATTAMARGEPALSAGVLMGSTVVTILIAGPLLALESAGGSVHPWHILVNLLLVVALPLVAGLALRAVVALSGPSERLALSTATVAVAALVALIAAEIHLSASYIALAGALLVFLACSAALGWIIGRPSPRPTATAALLTTSMRDFAIAASIATESFGPKAAAPLGLYGILVLIWGTALAGRMRGGGFERRGR